VPTPSVGGKHLSTNGTGKTGYPHGEKINFEPPASQHTLKAI